MNYDELAWKGGALPTKATEENFILYCIARTIYDEYKAGNIDKVTASKLKENAVIWLDSIHGLAHSNSKLIVELGKLTAPRAELVKRDKSELLEIINRIEALVMGLMKEFNGKMPEFIKNKE